MLGCVTKVFQQKRKIMTNKSPYDQGFNDGKQEQINKQTALVLKWMIGVFTALLFGAVGILASMVSDKLRASATGLTGGIIYSYWWGNDDIISTTLGSFFGI